MNDQETPTPFPKRLFTLEEGKDDCLISQCLLEKQQTIVVAVVDDVHLIPSACC